MLKRLVKAYLRRRHGIKCPWHRIRPPLGWTPWARVTLGRRIRYVLASRFWRFESALRDWAYRGEARPGESPFRTAYPDWLMKRLMEEALRPAPGRGWVAVPGEPVRIEGAFLLDPVGLEADGSVRPLDQLSYGTDLTDGAGI